VSEPTTFYDHWWILHRQRGAIATITASAMVTSILLSLLLPNVYEARTLFFVPAPTGVFTHMEGEASRDVARSLVIPDLRGERQKVLLALIGSDRVREAVHQRFPEKSVQRLRLDVDLSSGTDFLLKVYARDRNPERAAEIANAYVEEFRRLINEYSAQQTAERRRSLEAQLAATHEKLRAVREELASEQREKQMPFLSQEIDNLTERHGELEQQREEVRVDAQAAARKVEVLREQLKRESAAFAKTPVIDLSPAAEELQRQLSQLEGEIAAARAQYKEAYPQLPSMLARKQHTEEALAREIGRLMQSQAKDSGSFSETLRRDLVAETVRSETLKAREEGLAAELERLVARLEEVRTTQVDQRGRELEEKQHEAVIDRLRLAVAEATAHEARRPESVVVVDPAIPPEDATFPNPWLNGLVALALGLVAGVFYAYAVDYARRVRRELGDLGDVPEAST